MCAVCSWSGFVYLWCITSLTSVGRRWSQNPDAQAVHNYWCKPWVNQGRWTPTSLLQLHFSVSLPYLKCLDEFRVKNCITLHYSSVFYWDVPLKWAFPHFHLATSFPFSNISTREEMGWRRRSSRKVLNWHRCVTPSPSTPRAPMLSSRPLSPHSTPKVITHKLHSLHAQCGWFLSSLWFKP